MRGDWALKPLGDVCTVIGGGTPSKRNSAYFDGDIPWATVRDMKEENLSRTEFKISPEAVKNSATNIIPAGNVVIATRVGLGKVCLLGQNTAINQDLRGIIPKGTNVDVRFLFRWFQSIAHVIESEGTGATVKGVKLPFIKSLRMPIPPLSEQKRIVAILDEAFAGIATAVANTEKNLANARELFESYLNAVFSRRGEAWVDLTLREVCKDYGRGKSKHRPRNDPKLFGGKYPFIQTGDVRNSDHLIVDYSTTYNDLGLAQSKLWPKGTICITIAANIAETGILDFDACFPDSIIGLVVD
ncbi:restriction modification system DNA specificity protein, partial [Ectothiorhodospira haloalkaliphila]